MQAVAGTQGIPQASVNAWVPLTADCLTSDAIDALLADEVPYVRVPRFLEPEWCAEVSRRYVEQMKNFPENKLQVGPAYLQALVRPLDLHMHLPDMSSYFARAQHEAPRVREIYRGGEDPLDKLRSMWEAAGWTCTTAAEPEGPYQQDLIWSIIDGGQQAPHVDTYQSDRQTSLSRFARRISYNIFLQAPDSGGGFVVYRRRKQSVPVVGPKGKIFQAVGPEDAEQLPWVADPDYVTNLVADVARADYEIVCGDLVIFDACNYHDVLANTGHRIVSHANLAVDPIGLEFAFYV